MENRMESRFEGMEEMMRKLIEIQSKTPPAVPIANPHHDLTGILLAESKWKDIGREEFDEESSFHQKSPPRAPIRGGIRVLDGGITGREFYGGGGRVTNHYERPFGHGQWTIGEGGR
ncbi:hypothetical protein IEQ34_002800 [Dendrobium chrysotoxum]|uniref:Uncharacterized protein n=1 Tax=Dendrobium chrysotoxum TaxID=161865 RepID=A0AAV7HHK8_DENCH|nr:hypothetical protein IEQ34_002800 [Dendrobium chrysotoxum]